MTPPLSIEQLIAALQRRSIPLPFETGAFLVLEAAEHVIADPVLVKTADLRLRDDGEVIVPSRPAGETPPVREQCRALATVLGELLVCSAQSVPPGLLRLVDAGNGDGPTTPAQLRDQIEATLVPLNRAAMRRVLARLCREARRDSDEGRLRLSSHPQPLDQEDALDAVLAGRPVPAIARADGTSPDEALDAVLAARPARAARQTRPPIEPASLDAPPRRDTIENDNAELDALLSGLERPPAASRHTPEIAVGPASFDGASTSAPAVDTNAGPARSVRPRRPQLALGDQHDSLDRFEQDATRSRSLAVPIAWGLLALTAALVGSVLVLGPERSRSFVDLEPHALRTPAPDAVRASTRKYGLLRVASMPARAQVFMRIGTGPAVATKLPLGVVHEFAAVRSGFAPSRALVPADAEWRPQEGELRYELALQLREASAAEETELGASRVPAALGAATGAMGTVRVITSPPGAEVFQLIGFTPDVSLENVSTDTPVELLVYLPGYATKRIAVGPSDWKTEAGARAATLNVALEKRATPREPK